jgi:hypothetical protein
MANARIYGDLLSFEFQVQRLNRLRRHRHWRRDQRTVSADVDDARRLCQLEGRPESSNDFQSYARTSIAERHQRFTP